MVASVRRPSIRVTIPPEEGHAEALFIARIFAFAYIRGGRAMG
jgi:hypothetical protein